MHPEKQSTVTILGDSYSTFAGGVPEGNYLYYPNSAIPDVATMEDTWWRLLIQRRNLRLLVNDSSSGTTISARVRPNHTLADAFISRMKRCLSRAGVNGETPNLILIFGATNDSWIDNPIGQLQFENWSDEDLKAVLPAYCHLLDYVTAQNPQAQVVGVINCDLKPEIQQGIAAACQHYGALPVQLHDLSKINGHPDRLGMQQICDQIDEALKD